MVALCDGRSENMRPWPKYECSFCGLIAFESEFDVRVLSIMYRHKENSIQAFRQIKCSECSNLVTIVFETIEQVV